MKAMFARYALLLAALLGLGACAGGVSQLDKPDRPEPDYRMHR